MSTRLKTDGEILRDQARATRGRSMKRRPLLEIIMITIGASSLAVMLAVLAVLIRIWWEGS